MISQSPEPRPRPPRTLLGITVVVSVLLHGVAYAALGAAPEHRAPPPRKTQLRFEVVHDAPKPEAAPPTRPAPPPPPRPQPARPPAGATPAEPPPPGPPEPTSAPPSNPGVTLTGDGAGASFAIALGSGGGLAPPSPPARAPLLVAPTAPTRPTPPNAVALVPLGDLSARPSPPALGPALEANYPVDARRRGLSGSAKMKARIDPDGIIRRVELLQESANGFGAACQRTLSGSRWTPPKDRTGRSVATEIRYTCRFVVQP